MKKSIVKKLFLSVTILLVVFLAIVFVGQSLFLQSFYTTKKVSLVSNQLKTFVNEYKTESWTSNQLESEIAKFYNQYNTSIAILDKNGILKAENNFDLTVLTNKGEKIYIPLNNLLYSNDLQQILLLNLKKNEQVYIEGYIRAGYFLPTLIKTKNGTWQQSSTKQNEMNMSIGLDPLVKVQVSGTLVDLHLPLTNQYTYSAQMSSLMNAIADLANSDVNIEKYKESQLPITYDYLDKLSGTQNKVFVYPIHTLHGTDIIFALTSLQPVNEALFVLKGFYFYAFVIGLLLIIIISFYFSKVITKPLLKINKATNKLAQLDFSEKIDVRSNDEIGEISKSINSLSTRLENTISDLKTANKKLLDDIEKEKQLETIRKEFISGVSHELKTPLSVIQSYAEGIKDGLNQSKNDYYITVILEETNRMNELVKDMLDLSKMQSGTYHLQNKPYEIVRCVETVCDLMFGPKSENPIYQINVQIPPHTLVEGEFRRIQQVLINILSNAIKYSEIEKKITITISKKEEIEVSIYNEGTHIPEDQIEKIWDRFYRIDQSRTRESGGTGLGLAIVKTILDLHKSTITVKNIEKGVEFLFTLKEYSEE